MYESIETKVQRKIFGPENPSLNSSPPTTHLKSRKRLNSLLSYTMTPWYVPPPSPSFCFPHHILLTLALSLTHHPRASAIKPITPYTQNVACHVLPRHLHFPTSLAPISTTINKKKRQGENQTIKLTERIGKS